MVIEIETAEGDPAGALDELEISSTGVELDPQRHRKRKVDQRGPERDPTRIACDDRLIATCHQDKRDADQRNKCDERKERPMAHQRCPRLTVGTSTRSQTRPGRSSSRMRSGRDIPSGADWPVARDRG